MGARQLEGKTVIVALSGGIACYKAAEVVRLLVQAGARVRVIMTEHAQEFITPLTLQTLSGEPVATRTFDLTQESEIGHIRLADSADAIVVAPATANIIGKAAAGIGDDLLSTVLLATRAPVLVAPAMNVHMYENPIVQENIERLRARGYRILAPESGFLACGYEGAGRLADPSTIVSEVARALSPPDLRGEVVLVSAGPTREAVDPVRFLSNRSSGKMGYALAAAAWRRGAKTILVSGPTALSAPHGVEQVGVVTAAEMRQAVLEASRQATIIVMAAAVADYRPRQAAAQKIKKSADRLVVECERTADILSELAARKAKRLLIGFAAETERAVDYGREKLRAKHLDMIVVNDVSRPDAGFEVDTNAVVLVDASGSEEVALASKQEIADKILDRVVTLRDRRKQAVTPMPAARRTAGGKKRPS